MSESQFRNAYNTGYGDGVEDERRRAKRVDRPLWALAGTLAGLAMGFALHFASKGVF